MLNKAVNSLVRGTGSNLAHIKVQYKAVEPLVLVILELTSGW